MDIRVHDNCSSNVDIWFVDVLIMVTLILLRLSVTRSQNVEEPMNCDRFIDLVTREWKCLPREVFGSYNFNSDLTGEQLLAQVKSKCRNEETKTEYKNCLIEETNECPQLATFISEAADAKIGVFCDRTDVSAWLQHVLQREYRYKTGCDPLLQDKVHACNMKIYEDYGEQLDPNRRPWHILHLGNEVLQFLFHCLWKSFSSVGDSECGVPWQDLLVTVWIRYSASSPLGLHLSPVLLDRLKNVKETRNFYDLLEEFSRAKRTS